MRLLFLSAGFLICSYSNAQNFNSISTAEVTRVEKTLSADDMQGRKVFSPGIEKAAAFIRKEFKEAGLQPLTGSTDFNQNFTMVAPSETVITATLDGTSVDPQNVLALTADSLVNVNVDSHYKAVFIKK